MVGRQRQYVALAAAAAVVGLALVSGCGSSPRDEYVRIRSITIQPEAGDGSTIAALNFTAPTAMTTTDNSLVMSADATSDMPQQ